MMETTIIMRKNEEMSSRSANLKYINNFPLVPLEIPTSENPSYSNVAKPFNSPNLPDVPSCSSSSTISLVTCKTNFG